MTQLRGAAFLLLVGAMIVLRPDSPRPPCIAIDVPNWLAPQ